MEPVMATLPKERESTEVQTEEKLELPQKVLKRLPVHFSFFGSPEACPALAIKKWRRGRDLKPPMPQRL